MSGLATPVIADFTAVTRAWKNLWKSPIWIVGHALIAIIPIIFSYFTRNSVLSGGASNLAFGLTVHLVATVFCTLIIGTYQREYLRFLRGEKPRLKGIFDTAALEARFFILGVLFFLPSCIVWILVSLSLNPDNGVFMVTYSAATTAVSLLLYPFCFSRMILASERVSLVEALGKSWSLTMRAPWAVLFTLFMAGIVSVSGYVALCFGYLITGPIYLLAMAHIYEDNCGKPPSVDLAVQ